MRRLALLLALLVSIALASTATAGAVPGRSEGGAQKLTVMTWSLYSGASTDIFGGLQTEEAINKALALTWATVQATDFPARAQEIADEIARTKPDVVALQEAMLWQTQSPSDFNTTPATTVAYDYLQTLLAALAARGQQYVVATVSENLEQELPVVLSGLDIRFTDREAILVRQGLQTSNAQSKRFVSTYSLVTGYFPPIPVPRSWQSVDVLVGGAPVRVVNTHLESEDATVQTSQAGELLGALQGVEMRTVIAGNVGSRPDGTGTATYSIIRNAGFADAWASLRPNDAGYTCCQAADLKNAVSTLAERIDHVFSRGQLTPTAAELLGEQAADRTPGGLWPSDHAGNLVSFNTGGADEVVEATFGAVTVTSRRVTVRLTLGEPVQVRLQLKRAGKLLVSKTIANVEAGNRVVALRIPASVAPGRAQLAVRLVDEADNILKRSVAVRIPA